MVRLNQDKRGFTLVEMVVVIAIISVLTGLALPAMSGYISRAQETVCLANRAGLIRYARTASVERITEGKGELSLSDFMLSTEDEHLRNIKSHRCPSGGVYSVADDTLLCSIHTGSADGGDGREEVVPGTGIYVNSNWPESISPSGSAQMKKNDIYKVNGKYYLSVKNWNMSYTEWRNGVEKLAGNGSLLCIDATVAPTSPSGAIQIPSIKQGQLYLDHDGHYYIYLHPGGWGNLPPASYPEQWYLIK